MDDGRYVYHYRPPRGRPRHMQRIGHQIEVYVTEDDELNAIESEAARQAKWKAGQRLPHTRDVLRACAVLVRAARQKLDELRHELAGRDERIDSLMVEVNRVRARVRKKGGEA